MKHLGLILILCFCSLPLMTQEASSHVVMDDSYARVTRYTTESFETGPLQFDTVVIPISGGEISFAKRGTKYAYNGADAKCALLVELKKHWDVELRQCKEPAVCVRPIRVGQEIIGETRSVLPNGFISVYAHHMDKGGTFTSSYYTSKGSDHIVLVPLTPLKVNFSGVDEDLKAGTAYSSDASEVEVTAGDQDVRWVVVRIHK